MVFFKLEQFLIKELPYLNYSKQQLQIVINVQKTIQEIHDFNFKSKISFCVFCQTLFSV